MALGVLPSITCVDREKPASESDPRAPSTAVTTRNATADVDRRFLRSLVNHDEGLVRIALVAMQRSSQDSTKQAAHDVHARSLGEQTTMILLARSTFREEIAPALTQPHKAASDSLARLTSPVVDRAFYADIVAIDREALALIDSYAPRLGNTAVKRLARRIKREREADTTAFFARVR